MHQGWPKFVRSLVMATHDDGLAVVAYGPCRRVRRSHRRAGDADRGYRLPVRRRCPRAGDGGAPRALPVAAAHPGLGNWLPAWRWREKQQRRPPAPSTASSGSGKGTKSVTLTLPMTLRLTRGHAELASVHWGPLLFGLQHGRSVAPNWGRVAPWGLGGHAHDAVELWPAARSGPACRQLACRAGCGRPCPLCA